MRIRQNVLPNDRARVLTGAVAEVSRRLDLGPSMLSRIIGISQSSASRLLSGTYELREAAKEWELSAALVRIYRSLFALVGGDEVLAKEWLRAPNRAFSGQAPANLIVRIDGLVRVGEYLDAHRARV
ncbi:MAG TPA: MbcA/ParS/Xre antitoxin family protein [Azoarcus taiwanensis]|uniref:DUF2384 domain-containing protein n=1 Tax=Azoarcus taiwanensis TaxID=666964 RepID=A0A972J7A8_9RHOO|nr:MbcA/ParS/Xre antitoxin family protein [Azoarcus taiwanensis]NMG01554.1 DUF2384 domain-containing protein [Azoarcus taiwanensis]HRQ59350.1 MbcA/ParS/Xre antitoxin family protein [Azoarcus taiwanensis]